MILQNHMAKIIKQIVTFKASPEAVYNALMDQKLHARFTGENAKINNKIGGKFSVYGGYAEGQNLELIVGKKIVQTWRASDWADGVYSTVSFVFAKNGKNTKMTFTQTGVPIDQIKSIEQGWKDYYWTPMKEMFESREN
jgi:activator of HSP90 ATPase